MPFELRCYPRPNYFIILYINDKSVGVCDDILNDTIIGRVEVFTQKLKDLELNVSSWQDILQLTFEMRKFEFDGTENCPITSTIYKDVKFGQYSASYDAGNKWVVNMIEFSFKEKTQTVTDTSPFE